MEEEALKTMQILVHTIYAEEEQALESDEDIQGLARDACEECLQILKEPEKSQAKPATKILCAFITTTRWCFQITTGCYLTIPFSLCIPVYNLTGCPTPCQIISQSR